jgi:curved DNA-binding protein
MEDYYKTLGVARSATSDEIQRAYRKMAAKFHPDLNPDDRLAKEKFQKIQLAYEVLSEPEKRKLYDQYGHEFEAYSRAPGAGGGYQPGQSGNQQGFDLEDLFSSMGGGASSFEDLFGGGQRTRSRSSRAANRNRPQGNPDVESEPISIPFSVAVNGGQSQITTTRPDGEPETLTIQIPAGIEDGKKIRLRGKGRPGHTGRGDLLVPVKVTPHPCYRRRGMNLEVDVPLTLVEAALGTKIDLPTPRGTITLTVPAGKSSGEKLRVKGFGVKTDKACGDLFAVVQIVVPTLDDEGRRLLEAFRDHCPMPDPRLDLQG